MISMTRLHLELGVIGRAIMGLGGVGDATKIDFNIIIGHDS